MPVVKIRFRDDGGLDIDADSFPDGTCDMAVDEILEFLKQKGIGLEVKHEERKDDELLQRESIHA